MSYTADIQKLPRTFLPADFTITAWETLEPYFQDLLARDIHTVESLSQWMKDSSELEAAVSEDVCWRQIRMTCDTENKALEDAFTFFVTEIQPKMQPIADALNKKLMASPALGSLDAKTYHTYFRNVKKSIDLFREENIPLQSELAILQQQYGVIAGKMSVTVNGQEYTLQQAAQFLESQDRSVREEVYRKINERRLADKAALNQLFNELIQKRHAMAINAGFSSYTDYRFKELGRFDYTPTDCFAFQEAVEKQILPLVDELYEEKRKALGVDELRPWDLEAEAPGLSPLRPFQGGKELLEKTIACFDQLNPFFADCLRTMNNLGHFDLDSRKGKAPGGYNCPLAESGAPFIFMNAAGQMHDVTTMVHEGGHAIHSFLAHPLPLTAFKEYPMEVAELASMSMELFSMDHWEVFFPDPVERKRAKLHQLERVITIFPWIATIDAFQHWLYANPQHTDVERDQAWLGILDRFKSNVLQYEGLEAYRANAWQRQLHLFEVPFYYIEYGIAQLGAVGMWMQYKADPKKALNHYINALSLGGTQTLPELYQAAGLSFDFSADYIQTLVQFVRKEIKLL